MNIETIREKIKAGKYIISFTHTEKIRLREIEAEEIEEAICKRTIIEPYPDDSRGASCLILGFTNKGRPLHVVCGKLEEDEILIATAYEPDSKEWEADWKTDIVKSSMKNRSVTYRKTMKTLPLEGLILVHTGHRGCDNSFLQCHVTRL